METYKKPSDLPENFKDHPLGVGLRPSFHALWHLEALGVIGNLESVEDTAWTQAHVDTPARIALIDTPVDHHHPNLVDAIDRVQMRDFSLSNQGQFTVYDPDAKETEDRQSFFRDLDTGGNEALEGILTNIRNELTTKEPRWSKQRVPAGAHGTAMAGLIGGRPATAKLRRPIYLQGRDVVRKPSKAKAKAKAIDLPYCGVNPFSKIIPISISAVPDPEMLLAAVRYTQLIRPDIVVIADSWDLPKEWYQVHRPDPSTETKVPDDADRAVAAPWEALHVAFMELCAMTTVFCAAGNMPFSELVCPAGWSTMAAGPWAVGACGEDGIDLGYSPPQDPIVDAGKRMIVTLSGEVPRYDRDCTYHDTWAREDKEKLLPPSDKVFPFKDIITTDMRGRNGYNPSEFESGDKPGEVVYEIASMYCRFAGTSAATAIAAGLASLVPGFSDAPPVSAAQLKGLFTLDKAKDIFGNSTD